MKGRFLLLILCCGLLLTACGGTSEAETAQQPAEGMAEEEAPPAMVYKDTIVFVSNRGEDPSKLGLFLLDLQTKEVTAVETGLDGCLIPKWSPDGSQILFAVMNVWNLYTVKPDGTDLNQITDFRSNNGDWSPNGSQIVFQSDHQNEPEDTPDLYIMDSSGENVIEILDDAPNADYSPRWSPDGSLILFISKRTGKEEMFTIKPDGSEVTQLTTSQYPVAEADWSPDGTRIAFAYGPPNKTDLVIADADDLYANVVQLTNDENGNQQLTWSPDGMHLVFSSMASGSMDLWMIDADGNNMVQLTNDAFLDMFPDWSP